jgi:DNA-binding response OmpR family regulator
MRIAILESDREQAEELRACLARGGHDCHVFTGGRQFLVAAGRESFDILMMGWELSDYPGLEMLRAVRRSSAPDLPVIFVTQRDAETDVVDALNNGADDYVVLPLRGNELAARANAVWRRSNPRAEAKLVELPPYTLDVGERELRFHGRRVELTHKEFDLAAFLFRNVGRLLSRGHLLEAVWGKSVDVPTRTLDTHVSHLRTKLGLRPENGFRLATVYNFGYRLEVVRNGGGAKVSELPQRNGAAVGATRDAATVNYG